MDVHQPKQIQLTVETCTFNVGLIMLNLMEGTEMTCLDNSQPMRHTPTYSRCYSGALEELVFKCLEYNQGDRPSTYEVGYKTRAGLARWEDMYGGVWGDYQGQFAPSWLYNTDDTA